MNDNLVDAIMHYFDYKNNRIKPVSKPGLQSVWHQLNWQKLETSADHISEKFKVNKSRFLRTKALINVFIMQDLYLKMVRATLTKQEYDSWKKGAAFRNAIHKEALRIASTTRNNSSKS